MKIAMLAPPYLPVPPPKYGGTERIVHLLTEGLVARGHDVTLFASGDSTTSATLVSVFGQAIGNSGLSKVDSDKPLAHYRACYDRAAEFDIIHSHGQYLSLAGAKGLVTPVVFTWHGSIYPGETPQEKRDMLAAHTQYNFISISDNQRGGMPDLNFIATVYNALNISDYTFVDQNTGDYLLWIGRVSPKKGAHEAIQIAKRVGIRLEMAAAIDPIDRPYFERELKPLIDGKTVIYHGEVGQDALAELYGGALATLYPITWHEPFGLVMAESMACGTPVLAYNAGSVPEIVKDGLNGYVIDSDAGIDGFCDGVRNIGKISRAECRRYAEEHFSPDRMVGGYEAVYRQLTGHGT